MTRKYELLYVLNGSLPADELRSQMNRVQTIVEASAEVLDVNEWGRRRLAYEIQDLRDGYYVIVHFMAEPDRPKEIERLLRIADYVLRYLIVTAEGSFVPAGRRSLDDEEAEEATREAAPEEAAAGTEEVTAEEETEVVELEAEGQEEKSEEAPEETPEEMPVTEPVEEIEAPAEEASPEEDQVSPEMPERTD